MPNAKWENIDKYLPFFNKYLPEFGINSIDKISAFFAQIGHESMNLNATSEIWGPTVAQRRYENNKDLGNTQPGDGSKYRGHGLIQVTGRANHTAFNKWLHDKGLIDSSINIVDHPELIATNPELAVLSAFWYWEKTNLNNYS